MTGTYAFEMSFAASPPPSCAGAPAAFGASEPLRRRSAFPMTETELKLIAAAAIAGESSKPKTG